MIALGTLTVAELLLATAGPFPPSSDIHWELQREIEDERRARAEDESHYTRLER